MKLTSKFLFLPIILILFSFIGCQQQHDLEKITSQVNKMNDIMTKAVLENDSEIVLTMYTEDGISMPSYQPMIKGLEALKKHNENQPPMNMKTFSLTSTDIWASGNFVVDIGTYDLSMEMPDAPGGEWADHGKYLTLFEIQKDGSLLMKAETWNTDTNPWMDMMQHEGNKDDVESKM